MHFTNNISGHSTNIVRFYTINYHGSYDMAPILGIINPNWKQLAVLTAFKFELIREMHTLKTDSKNRYILFKAQRSEMSKVILRYRTKYPSLTGGSKMNKQNHRISFFYFNVVINHWTLRTMNWNDWSICIIVTS